ncbi:hypothetical protein MGLY_01510 [Neomoorella glycerini]|uniref:RmlC-like jelly roll fold n=1 Tax=Neomoorella glycerini TaxID=55779 RepID=A0A6I5ZLT0_9FIRM|nr:hypothetical protein [Moorella glycerini]QGP90840.1 hypothetical protein MGLY_01510 [Moorella glycerini]
MTVLEEMLQVASHAGEGYRPVIYFGAWRVALLNDAPEFRPEALGKIEKHLLTDEVFVLVGGKGLLIVADGDDAPGKVYCTWMEPGKVYNVRQGVWHWVLTERVTKMLIVENRDTSVDNSRYARLTPVQIEVILASWQSR